MSSTVRGHVDKRAAQKARDLQCHPYYHNQVAAEAAGIKIVASEIYEGSHAVLDNMTQGLRAFESSLETKESIANSNVLLHALLEAMMDDVSRMAQANKYDPSRFEPTVLRRPSSNWS